MPQQPAKPGVRGLEALGLTVFLATAAFLTALFLTRIGSVFDSLQTAAASFSTLCAAVAAFGMLLDAADLWVRGRKMTPQSVRMFRMMVFVAVLGALAGSMLGGNSLVVLLLAPAMVVYLFISRKRPAGSYATAPSSRGRTGGGRVTTAPPAKSRQRKGGKKHR